MSKLNLRLFIRLTMTGQQMELLKNITLIVLVFERFEPSKKKAVVALPYFLSSYFIQCFINAFLSKFFHWSFCWELFFCLTRAMVLKHFFENSRCCNVGWKANGRKLLEPRSRIFFFPKWKATNKTSLRTRDMLMKILLVTCLRAVVVA